MSSNILFILDNVRSLYNVGSIMRSTDCVGGDIIYCCGITGTPELKPAEINAKKTALAAYDSVKWQYFKNTADAINAAKAAGYAIYIVEQFEGAINLAESQLHFPAAFVLGHETDGVNPNLKELADEIIQLPNVGASKSWNVSSTAAVIAFESWKQLKNMGK